MIKQIVVMQGYSRVVKPVLFRFEPERVHLGFIKLGKLLSRSFVLRSFVRRSFKFEDERLGQNILGISFKNPVGLSAGFDKDAELIGIMGDVGFGFSEVGSVTMNFCEGNNGRRLGRLENGLWVNLGLNNKGADEISSKLKERNFEIPFGVSVARTNCKESSGVEEGIKDYVYSLKKFKDIGSYLVLNISCPNAFGGEAFSNPVLFEKLIREVDKLGIQKPVFVKIGADLSFEEVDKIMEISFSHKVDGFVISNLTKNHGIGRGGLSGGFVKERADGLLRHAYLKNVEIGKRFVLIGVGGIFNAEDAYIKIKLGANLVELITGMIYRGPGVIGEINKGLVELLERDGYGNIGEAVGSAVKC